MKSRTRLTGITAALGMLILILDSKTAISGAYEGIELCLKSLVPSLFPFFVLSILVTSSLSGSSVALLRPVGRLCGVPQGAESLLAVGLLGGYPVGAQNVKLAYEAGRISKSDAQRMLCFCNNAGPAFLFGIIGPAFGSAGAPWALWGIHIASALIVGTLIRGGAAQARRQTETSSLTLTQALQKSVTVMAYVCGWVVLFRMILTYLDRWFLWMLPTQTRVAVSGILELSNGCVQLNLIKNTGLRFILASVFLSLGGVCVALQTASVTQGLSLKTYFPCKLLQAAVSFLLAAAVQYLLPVSQTCTLSPVLMAAVFVFTIILAAFLRKPQKSSSIPVSVGV